MKERHDRILSSGLIKFDENNNAYSVPFDWNKMVEKTKEELHLMQEAYADVGLYIDKESTIYAIPCGWDRITQKAVNTAEVDLLFVIRQPYSDDELETFLLNAMDNCYKKEREPGLGPLEKHFGVKSWVKAVEGLKFISFSWVKKEGYNFIPSTKTPRKGYNHPQEDEWICIGTNPQKGALAKAFHKALGESTC